MKESINKQIQNALKIINFLMVIYLIVMIILKSKISALVYPINTVFFMLLTFYSILIFGYKKNKKSMLKDRISNIFIISSIVFLIVIFIIGGFTELQKNAFNISKTLYLFSYIALSEILRYQYINKSTKNNKNIYLFSFLYILIDIFIINDIASSSIITISIISIIKNVLLTYTTSKYGYNPCLIYAFIVELLPIISPIYLPLNSYLYLVSVIVYSLIIYFFISKPYRKTEEETANVYKKSISFYVERLLLVIILIIIFLVSGVFKYSLSAIASNSMYPALKKGDAIIIEKLDKMNEHMIKEGVVIAFKDGENIITHRIESLVNENGEEYIITKGDNNPSKDVTKKKKDDIIGIVKFRIPLLGYPSIEISEIKNK